MGKVGPVENGESLHRWRQDQADHRTVRMLLKQGHKGVYISRAFATRHGMIPRKVGKTPVDCF